MKRTTWLWPMVGLLLAACGTDPSGGGEADTSTGDVESDTVGDAQVDVDEDIRLDIGDDSTVDAAEDVGEDTALDIGDDTALDVGEDTATDVPTEVAIDAACEEGTTTSFEVVCDDGRFANVTCECVDGALECGPDPCGVTLPCTSDMDCAPGELCQVCSPEDPVPCDPGCYDAGCPTQGAEELTCFAARPVCRDGQVAVVTSGCWECATIATCNDEPIACDDVGGFCTAGPMGCPAGFEVSGEAVCASLSDCCVPSTASDCTRAGATCVDADTCPDGTSRIRSSCEPEGGICCQGTLPPIRVCDDGSFLECDMIEPTCEPGSVSAVIGGCWQCVNPLTCLPWGEPGCETDRDCDRGEECNDCATSSCPFCEDCVAACVTRGGP